MFQVWAEFNKAGPHTLDFTLVLMRGADGLPGLLLTAAGYGPPDHPSDEAGVAQLAKLADALPTLSTSTAQVCWVHTCRVGYAFSA